MDAYKFQDARYIYEPLFWAAPWREAWASAIDSVSPAIDLGLPFNDGPVWLVGPLTHGNFYGLSRHELRRPREVLDPLRVIREDPGSNDASPYSFVRETLKWQGNCCGLTGLWGIEWRLGDEVVARVTREEMGL